MLEIRSLGGLSVLLDGTALAGLASRKATALLVYLAYTRGAHSREVLAELLWEEQSQEQALGNLRVALASLKASVAPYLEITRHTLAWNAASPTYFDAYELACHAAEVLKAREQGRLLRDDERRALDGILAEYRGDFLHGFYLKDSAAFEEWASLERERLRRFAAETLCSLADEAFSRGEYRQAAARAGQLLLIDPTKEECHRKAMLSLVLAGDRSGALAQFERCRKVLADELDVQPEPETLALYRRIRDGELAPPSGPWENYLKSVAAPDLDNAASPIPKLRERNLATPARPLTSFIGRDTDLAALVELLSSNPRSTSPGGATGLITLCGPAGCGKTRLALEVAAATGHLFPDGSVLLDLATMPEPGLLHSALASALGVHEQAGVRLIDALTASLEKKRTLIILDGCEHLAAAAGQLAVAILRAAPGVRILATSQAALGAAEETRWQVNALAVPPVSDDRPTGAEEAGRYPAVRLFVDRARAVNRNFVLTDPAVPAVVRICRRLDGMPLALELAAAHARLLSPQQIADRLDDMFRLLQTAGPSSRYNSLYAAIAWSCSLLNPTERILLRRLTVFRGEFTLEAAEFVCAGDGLGASEILPLLAALGDKSFLLSTGEGGDGSARYRLLEVMRQHIAEWLELSGEAETARRRHLAFYAALAEAMEDRLRGPDQGRAREQIELDYDNYHEAVAWGLGSGGASAEDALRLIAALSEYWQRADRLDVARTWTDRALTVVDRAPPGLQARVYSAAGSFAWLQGEYEEAARRHGLSLQRAEAAGDRAAAAFALNNLGVVACYEDRLAAAGAWFQEALAIYGDLGDARGIATVLINLNLLAGIREEYPVAQRFGERALPMWRQLGDDYQLGTLLHNLGDLARIQGDFDRARVLLEESIILCRKQNNRRLLMMSLTALGRLALKQGDREGAVSRLREGLILSRELGDKRWLAEHIEALGEVAVAEGQFLRATRLFGGAMTMLAALKTTLWLPDLLEHRAAIELAQGALSESRFAAEWETGSAMTGDRIFALAMSATGEAAEARR